MVFNRRYIKLGAIALPIALLVMFIVQNMAIVELKFLVWSVEVRRSLIILGVFAIGILIGRLIYGFPKNREGDRTR